MSNHRYNVVIIGGGPAGLSASLYTSRSGLSTAVFAGSPPGGQLMLTSEVENFPGVKNILGPDLIQSLRDQSSSFGTRIFDQNIKSIVINASPFILKQQKKVFQQTRSLLQLEQRHFGWAWILKPAFVERECQHVPLVMGFFSEISLWQ